MKKAVLNAYFLLFRKSYFVKFSDFDNPITWCGVVSLKPFKDIACCLDEIKEIAKKDGIKDPRLVEMRRV